VVDQVGEEDLKVRKALREPPQRPQQQLTGPPMAINACPGSALEDDCTHWPEVGIFPFASHL